jgi:hypothetical protein
MTGAGDRNQIYILLRHTNEVEELVMFAQGQTLPKPVICGRPQANYLASLSQFSHLKCEENNTLLIGFLRDLIILI